MVSHLTAEYFEDEDLLDERPLSEVMRRVAARAIVDADESQAAESTRPTVALYPIGPWR